jgi:hypothetical protein
MMSQHLLGGVGLLVFGLQRRILGVLLLGVVLLSTSSTAYFGLLMLFCIWLLISSYQSAGKKPTLVALVLALFILAVCIDFLVLSGQITQRLVLEKFDSGSGQVRLNADGLAVQSFIESFGLGAGVGSARASSLTASLAATVGLPGLLLFVAFLWSVFACVYRQRSDQERAVFFGMVGLLVAWLMATPDINIAFFWILAGLASSYSPSMSRHQSVAEANVRNKLQGANV